jgi:hypothetical protein
MNCMTLQTDFSVVIKYLFVCFVLVIVYYYFMIWITSDISRHEDSWVRESERAMGWGREGEERGGGDRSHLTFDGIRRERRRTNYTWLSKFRTFMILSLNCTGSRQKSYKITLTQMFATKDKAKPSTENIRGLNSVAVRPTTVQVTSCRYKKSKSKAVPLHAMEALGGRGDIAPTHSRPRH